MSDLLTTHLFFSLHLYCVRKYKIIKIINEIKLNNCHCMKQIVKILSGKKLKKKNKKMSLKTPELHFSKQNEIHYLNLITFIIK